MKKGWTFTEVLAVIIIIAIAVLIVAPGIKSFIKRGQMREISVMLDSIRAGAKYYDFKYQLTTLDSADPWSALRVQIPRDARYTYSMVDEPTTPSGKQLQVKNSDGVLLYTYNLPDGPGVLISGTEEERYLGDLPTGS